MSPTLTALRGLPGSGKSTLAHAIRAAAQEAGRRCVVVGRDPIRDWATVGWHGGPAAEALVTAIQHAAIGAALADGADVVVDDTNLSAAALAALSDLARRAGAELVVRDVGTDVETCVRRDAARPGPSRCPVGR